MKADFDVKEFGNETKVATLTFGGKSYRVSESIAESVELEDLGYDLPGYVHRRIVETYIIHLREGIAYDFQGTGVEIEQEAYNKLVVTKDDEPIAYFTVEPFIFDELPTYYVDFEICLSRWTWPGKYLTTQVMTAVEILTASYNCEEVRSDLVEQMSLEVLNELNDDNLVYRHGAIWYEYDSENRLMIPIFSILNIKPELRFFYHSLGCEGDKPLYGGDKSEEMSKALHEVAKDLKEAVIPNVKLFFNLLRYLCGRSLTLGDFSVNTTKDLLLEVINKNEKRVLFFDGCYLYLNNRRIVGGKIEPIELLDALKQVKQ